MSGELLAGLRSASWTASPNTRSAHAWHIAVDGYAACNSTMPLMPQSLAPAEMALDDVRCRARACARQWETVSSRRYGHTLKENS